MEIDKVSYSLNEENYVKNKTNKNKIVIGSSYSTDMKHFLGWTKRLNGKYDNTAMYTIRFDGTIYEHFSPNYYSNLLTNPTLCKESITILLENEGWLIKNLNNENEYINYVGNIYNRKDEVVEKSWRNKKYWAPFTKAQLNSAIDLVNSLCDTYNIMNKVISNNVSTEGARFLQGILYRSNLEKYCTDISPAWDFNHFKNEIEKNKNIKKMTK